jgi:hypothetical protein
VLNSRHKPHDRRNNFYVHLSLATSQTVINQIFPLLIPAINRDNKLPYPPIDVFDALDGANASQFPPGGCTPATMHNVTGCIYHCGQDPEGKGNITCDNCREYCVSPLHS